MTARFAHTLCAILFIYTIARILLVVLVNPPIAYPNNGDFAREQACYGIWDDNEVGAWQSPKAFRYTGHVSLGWCAFSSDNIFLGTTSLLYRPGDRIDSRAIGVLRAAALIGVFLLCMVLARSSRTRLLIAVSFAAGFGDLGYMMYLRTLYSDPTSLASAYFACIGYLIYRESRTRAALALTVVALLALGLSKGQYAPFAIVVSLLAATISMRQNVQHASSFLGAGIGIIAVLAILPHNHVRESSASANTFDTVMTALLPNSPDTKEALRALNLSDACRAVIGHSWYDGNIQYHNPCPEAINVTRFTMARLFLKQPKTFFAPAWHAAGTIHTFDLPKLAAKARAEDDLAHAEPYRLLRATSISHYLDEISSRSSALMSAGIVFGGFVIGLILFKRNQENDALVVFYASGLAFYTVVSSVFGDGYLEIEKHGMCVLVSIALLLGCLACNWRRHPSLHAHGEQGIERCPSRIRRLDGPHIS